MNIEIAQSIVAALTDDQRGLLEAAHWRYMAFAGVIQDSEYQQQAKADREAYPHLLKFKADGEPSVSTERAADFMAAVTGLARDWCVTWDEHDFYETHGVTQEEAMQTGHVSDVAAQGSELAKHSVFIGKTADAHNGLAQSYQRIGVTAAEFDNLRPKP